MCAVTRHRELKTDPAGSQTLIRAARDECQPTSPIPRDRGVNISRSVGRIFGPGREESARSTRSALAGHLARICAPRRRKREQDRADPRASAAWIARGSNEIDQRDRNVTASNVGSPSPPSSGRDSARLFRFHYGKSQLWRRPTAGNHIRLDLMVLKGRQRAATLRRLSSI